MMPLEVRQHEDGVLFDILVNPDSGRGGIRVNRKNGIVISTCSPASRGLANKEVLKHLRVALGREVSIYKTHRNHKKTIFVSDISCQELKRLLNITW